MPRYARQRVQGFKEKCLLLKILDFKLLIIIIRTLRASVVFLVFQFLKTLNLIHQFFYTVKSLSKVFPGGSIRKSEVVILSKGRTGDNRYPGLA